MRTVWTDIRQIIAQRKSLLGLGFLVMAINRLAGMVLPYSTRFLIDDVIGKSQRQKLVPMILIIVGATLVQGAAAFLLGQLIARMGHRLVFELRQKVQQHIGVLSLSYHEATRVGTLVSRIMADVDGIRNLVGWPILEFVGGLITTVIAVGVLIRISPLMTLLVGTFVVSYAALTRKAFARLRPLAREGGRITAEVTGRLTESLAGIRVVKSYHAETAEAQAFTNRLTRLLNNVLITVTTTAFMNLLVTLLTGLLGAAVWYVGMRSILAGSMTVGTLMTFVAFLAYLVNPVLQSVTIGTQLTEALAGLERTREVLNELPEDRDPARIVVMGQLQGEVTFERVCFSYEAGKRVIHDLSFHAPPGSITALVGPSGAGKSTIIKLLAAFHNPEQGRILVDSTDLATVRLDSYRTQLGVVLQDSFLFDGSIAENIAFSRPSATREEIIEACRIAHVDEFVDRLACKYDTVVGERGVKLSGGQRQRASIARAILANPRILILDEATSSLDSESEELIQEGLKFLMKNRTTVVIAHRLSTIRQADQILVLEQGRVVECGTHDSLCKLGRRYWSMYSRQRGIEENLLPVVSQGVGR
jgi:subfamily B ATP-binding cassette protein MsbA